MENKLVNFAMPNPYQADMAELARRQRMAEMLQQQAAEPVQKFGYGGIEVPISPLAGLAKALNAYSGKQMERDVIKEQKELGERYRADQASDMQTLVEALKPREAQQAYPASEESFGVIPAGAAKAAKPAGALEPAIFGSDVLKTPEMRNFAFQQYLAQLAPKAPIKVSAGEALLDPKTLKPIFTAAEKTPFAPIDVKDFTPESIAAATKPDGTIDRTKLLPRTQSRTGELGLYDEYVKQTMAQGKTPIGIEDWTLRKIREGRTPAAVNVGAPIAATDANGQPVFIQPSKTGGAPVVVPGFTPPSKELKPIPPHINTAISQNQVLLNKIDRATNLVNKNPDATGIIYGSLPIGAVNRMDTTGIETRAALSEIAASKIHDLSGAAVSVSEFARLKPFLPQLNDNAETLKTKLANMKREIQDIASMHSQMYSPDQGYKPNPILTGDGGAAQGQTRVPRYNPATGRIE